jgi:DNA-binding winged helix-turn-helix (wHTH) protein/Flp pilus assembly protein TadD
MAGIIRFGVFEVSPDTGELRKSGVRVRLQAQPFRVLTLLLERPGQIVTRDRIVKELWGSDTFVDFDQSVGAVIRRLRQSLGDSAGSPRYVETLRHKGYRFLAPVQAEEALAPPLPVPAAKKRNARPWLRRMRARIAAAVVASAVLMFGLSGRRPVPDHPRNMEAWAAYQKGRYLWNARTAHAIEESIEYFQRAVSLDPTYAPAYAGLADAYVILNFYSGRYSRASMERAKAASVNALRLNHDLAEPHATQAYIKFYYDWDWRGAETSFRRAVALGPDFATAHEWYSEYLFYMGRFQEALRAIRRAYELDPQSLVINLQLASPYLYAREYTQAIERIREAMRLNPDFPLGIFMLATCYEQQGRFDEAVAEYRKIAGTGMGLSGLAYALGKSGRSAEARAILQQLTRDTKPEDLSAYHVARVYAGLSDAGQTLTWLRRAQATRDERMVMLMVDPKLDLLRGHPGFDAVLREMGLNGAISANLRRSAESTALQSGLPSFAAITAPDRKQVSILLQESTLDSGLLPHTLRERQRRLSPHSSAHR